MIDKTGKMKYNIYRLAIANQNKTTIRYGGKELAMNLREAQDGKEYIISRIETDKVGGMHCEHCKLRVEEAVNDIRGVSGRVDLRREELTVSYGEAVDDEVILTRLERAGYSAEVK